MKKRFLPICLIFVFLAQFAFTPSVRADGAFFVFTDLSGWKSAYEDEQLAAINYENGRQNMLLEINLPELNGDKAFWIFPVPAQPDTVNIDIVKAMPQWDGNKPGDLYTRNIISGSLLISATQIYGIIPYFASMFIAGSNLNVTQNGQDEVQIHQQLKKMGLTTELITANNTKAFSDYISSKDLVLTEEMNTILENYSKKDYSFIFSWISDLEKFKEAQESYEKTNGKYIISVYTSFPTENIYFPLIPTSIYGERKIPIRIQIVGHVKPIINEVIENDTTVDYLIDDWGFKIDDNLSTFFNNKSDHFNNFKFTDIHIDTASSKLTHDLWVKPKAPLSISLIDFFNSNLILLLLLMLMIISGLSSLIAGKRVLKEERISPYKLFFLGLFNLLTVIGLSIAVKFIKIDGISLKNRGFVKNFMLYFFIFNLITPFILSIPLLFLI